MKEDFWLINSNLSRVKRKDLQRISKIKINFLNICLLTLEEIIGVLSREPPFMTTTEELKVDTAINECQKLSSQGWNRNKPVWDEVLIANIVTRLSYINYEI